MDVILQPLLRSREGSEREHLLGDLIFSYAAPLVRHTLRLRLGFYVNALGVNSHNHDAEDLYHDVVARLLQLLNDPQLYAGEIEVNNFRQYVTRVATNACHDYLRAKSPARARLKNNLRDLLDRHRDFAAWKAGGEVVCGFALWRGDRISSSSSKRVAELEENTGTFRASKFPGEDVRQVPLTRVVAEIFDTAGSPIEMDRLVSLVADLLEVKDHPVESLDDEHGYWNQRLADQRFRCGSRLEEREVLGRLWAEVRKLPFNQRATVCLGFEDECGDDLFSLLVDAGLVTWQQLVREFDRTHEQLMLLWQKMPMDSAAIGDELGVSRQQVNKWRFRALRQLEKSLTLTGARK